MTQPAPDPAFEQAKAFFLRGVQLSEGGDFAGAERQFLASLALLPGRASTLVNLGIARFRLGRMAEAVEPLEEALGLEPQDVNAWLHLALARSELRRLEPALQAVERATTLAPAAGLGWSLRGDLLRELGRPADAIAAHERALALGFEPELQRYYLAALRGDSVPPAPPTAYVRQLFDSYAGEFDQHLVQALGYRAPQLLVDGLQGRRFQAALDLGCGTGLCAPLLRPIAQRLDGIDLSPNMVRQARARGLYDEVVEADLAPHLAATPRRYDLLLAADVFIYVGDLEAVFAGAARVLEDGGAFCFSVEAADEQERLVLRRSLRYAHSEGYIRTLADRHGFDLRATARHPLRIDQGQPLAGLFAWLARRGRVA
ncbi:MULTISPECIES: methyltransferase domain-containing protein [Ramlibacter]|uniref:Methyltransferase domain-containing protein n=1 Tax=Ramlibacter pinisoli TaxID=2682844 RepID=A0A6N8IU02_9BURK|nr:MULTISPECIES: methyltransferase domain-containing protein [Ramlibacter]MBA2965473.1 methyltransferase domain-containing protein [Ramlibacter sp. CGMCC 1.13660]MVQ30439.1 methyltransferase domain-containing protein [Ramlibacter pinisoli]